MNYNQIFDLQRFDVGHNVNTTEGIADNATGVVTPYNEGEGLSEEMRVYYADYLLDNATPKLVHDQFGQKLPVPTGSAKTVRFRKYDPLPKLTESLVEGVTPNGQSLSMSVVEAAVHQYGGYVELSDLLMLTAVDNNLVMVTKLLGAQAGRTLDAITREVLCGGTNVQYADGSVSARHLLVGGEAEGNHYLTVDCIKRAVRFLKSQGAEKINGAYACIIHPDCAYDLTNDLNWKYPYQYAEKHPLYEGEIGMLEGVRFVESADAKVFRAAELLPGYAKIPCAASGYLLMSAVGNSTAGTATRYRITLPSGLKADPCLIGREIIVCDVSDNTMQYAKIVGINAITSGQYVYLDRALRTPDGSGQMEMTEDDYIASAEAGYNGRSVYATILLGENAYGTTELEGGGLEHIVKQLGSAGTADPLNQRATVGWKATKAAVRLMEPFMIRIETASTFESDAN